MTKQLTTIYILRHGQSEGNLPHDTAVRDAYNKYGKLGTPLTPLGIHQAQEVAKKLSPIHFDAIFSSDLKRAEQTAEIIAKERNMQVTSVSTIREREYGGEFWKLTTHQRKELEKAVFTLNEEERLLHKFYPDGESSSDAVGRFKTFLEEIAPLYPGKTILIVNHGNVMRTFLISIGFATYLELPSGSIKNTGYIVLETAGETFTIKETQGIHKKV